jgi:predicted CXXCH cytochrome family protein
MEFIHGLMIAAALVVGPAPQQQPAAAGKAVCAGCHEAVTAQFDRSAHSGLVLKEGGSQIGGCEACHGSGVKHAEAGGGAEGIRSFKTLSDSEAAQACLSCHRKGHAMEWAGSAHQMAGVTCTDCHAIHQSRKPAGMLQTAEGFAVSHATAPADRGSLAKPQTELCLGCHQQIRTKLMSQSRHPIREGRMSCSSCHESHGGGIKSVKSTQRPNDLCLSCHTQHQGPFIFEHAPVEESCMTCHDPHGAMANNMLKQNEPFLCLQCHEMHFHAARAGQTTPYLSPSAGLIQNKGGTTGFMQAYNTRCTNCHVKVHGSDLPSQGVTGKGKAFTR